MPPIRRLFIFAAFGFCASAQGQTFNQVVAFGDSLSDVGNVDDATFGFSPGSDYYNGRFSNGPVWIENVATSLSLSPPTPSRNSGRNYAHGGVKTGSGNTSFSFLFFTFSFPNAGTQVSNYVNNNVSTASQLYSVWAGGNDLIDNLSVNTQSVVNNLVNHVTTLNNDGARFALVPNLPLLGETPRYRNTANRQAYNSLTANFNSQLASAMDALDASLPIKLYQVNVEAMFSEVLASPAEFGLTNVTQPALVNGNVVANPDQYLFWDDIHPTRVGHQFLAQRAKDLIDTHEWIGSSGNWDVSSNWDYAGIPSSHWIAAMENTSLVEKTATLAGAATVRQLRIGGDAAAMRLSLGGQTLNVSESAVMQDGAILRTDLGPSSGQLNVGGSVALDGSLEIGLQNGFTALPGDEFEVLQFGSRSGDLSLVNLTGYAGLWFDKSYSATTLTLLAQAQPGDANLDALVDSIDFGILISNYATGGANWLAGDFTDDQWVNTLDFNLLAGNFGQTVSEAFAPVPEPGCAALGILLLITTHRLRGRDFSSNRRCPRDLSNQSSAERACPAL